MSRQRRLQPGDELLVSGLEDLANSLDDLPVVLSRLAARGVRVRFVDEDGPASDVETRALMRGVTMAAEFHRRATAARLKAEVIGAREAGLFPSGRPRTLDPQRVAELRAAGLGVTTIAARIGVARSSVYRKLKEIEAPETRRLKS